MKEQVNKVTTFVKQNPSKAAMIGAAVVVVAVVAAIAIRSRGAGMDAGECQGLVTEVMSTPG